MRWLLRSSIVVTTLIAAPLAAFAATGVDWTVTPPESGNVVGEEAHVTGEGSHLLVIIQDPNITSDSYSVRGSVRYEGVEGSGYLEMWSYFSDGGAYFSRTLGDDGPMAALEGNSRERPFELPFFLDGAAPPNRLEINVVLPGGGEVWVGPLTLEGAGSSDAWWTPEQGGLIGAIAGTILGLAGALVGVLASRGRNGRLVVTILKVGLAAGVLILIAGLWALVAGQPGYVWGPLFIIGGVEAFVAGSLIPSISRRFAQAELHRIHALDTSSG